MLLFSTSKYAPDDSWLRRIMTNRRLAKTVAMLFFALGFLADFLSYDAATAIVIALFCMMTFLCLAILLAPFFKHANWIFIIVGITLTIVRII